MIKICLQAGHWNAKNNCDPLLAKGTGAPGEAEFTVRIMTRLSQLLIERGFQLYLKDACYNCDPTVGNEDYNLFLAIHYDANVYGQGGGFVDFPEPSTDLATAESQRICKILEETYFPNAGIENKPSRRNANTKYYYMWKFLSAKTPCVIIECGVGQDAHDKVILNDTDIVASAIGKGICKAFNVEWEKPTPPTPTPPTTNPVPPTTPSVPNCQIYTDKLKQINTIANSSWVTWLKSRNLVKELSK